MKIFLILVLSFLTLHLPVQFRDEAVWVSQSEMTADFRFELFIWHDQQLPRHGTVYAVRVVDRKSGRTFQTDSVLADLGQDSLRNILHIQDCNFDGYQDFYFFNYMGNVNSTYNFLLYDHNKGKFVFNEAMATLTDPWFDIVDSIIGTSFRASASDHGIAEYRFKGDSLYKTAL
jgi:hypothetical protein